MLPHFPKNAPATTLRIAPAPLVWAKSVFPPGVEHEISEYTPEQRHQIAVSPRQKRTIDFAMGRQCAQTAMARLGNEEVIGVQRNRAPSWPSGFVGSISHSEEYAWAAVCRDCNLMSVGVDTESIVDSFTRLQLFSEILSNDEWDVLDDLDLDDDAKFTIAFSTKESFYKAWSGRTGKFFDFHQAKIRSADERRVWIEMTPKNPNAHLSPQALEIHFLATELNVFTATWMEQP